MPKELRTYPEIHLGTAENGFGLEQGVFERRIPEGIYFQTERSAGPKEPQPHRVANEITSGCVRFGEDRPVGIPVAKAALPQVISLATALKVDFGIGSCIYLSQFFEYVGLTKQ